MKIEIDTYTKTFLSIASVIAACYGAWQIFEEYNTNTLELETVKSETATQVKELAVAIIDSRAESAKEREVEAARFRVYYQEKKDEGTATPADLRRLKHYEEIVPKLEDKTQKLEEKLESVEKL